MVLKVGAGVPLVWRSPSSLQFGVDDPLVVLDDVDAGTERMIAALVPGISRTGFDGLSGFSPSNTTGVSSDIDFCSAITLITTALGCVPAARQSSDPQAHGSWSAPAMIAPIASARR